MEIISHLRVYDLEETLIASGYAMIEDYQEEIVLQQLLMSIDSFPFYYYMYFLINRSSFLPIIRNLLFFLAPSSLRMLF